MSLRNLILAVSMMCSGAAIAQTTSTNPPKINGFVASIELELSNADAISKFDWSAVKEVFKDNDPDQAISISLAFKKDQENSSTDSEYLQKAKVTGITKNLDELINNLKKIFKVIDK